MRSVVALGVTAVVLWSASAVGAEELKSGLQPGQSLPAFQVVKIGGADDNVKVGQELCYR